MSGLEKLTIGAGALFAITLYLGVLHIAYTFGYLIWALLVSFLYMIYQCLVQMLKDAQSGGAL